MRLPLILMVVTLLFSGVVDFYIYRIARKRCRSARPSKIQLWSALVLYLILIVGIVLPARSGDGGLLLMKMWVLFGYMTVLIPKVIFVFFDLLGSIPRLWNGTRCSSLSLVGGIIAVIVFCAMWWGALVNRFNIDVEKLDVEIPGLPEAFEDYRIVQISDLHVGTYGENVAYIEHLVEFINELQPDLIVFTGDVVNRKTDEIYPFTKALSELNANDGVISILGNHDYGDYYDWDSDSTKAESLRQMIDIQRGMGWNLLLNDHTFIHHGSDSIAVIGVENVGDPPFTVYGDLKASYPDLSDNVTKILLTHNPAHWSMEIADQDSLNIALTLSGHTHAMQISAFGISPAALRYKTWGGMYYDESGRHPLYVNIGIGTVGMPMRLGATPEITLFTLKRK
jgi:hypothetical protein